MTKNTLINGETMDVSLDATLVIELFLNENYLFRRNVLNGKVEFLTKPDEDFRPLTPAALNSIIIRAKREQVLEKGSPKAEISEYVTSKEVPEHNPVQQRNFMPQRQIPLVLRHH